MGVYKKIGVRKLALNTVNLITWIRLYGLKNGTSLSRSLATPRNGYYKVDSPLFRAPIWLRDNFSDKAIFHQVFSQRQYHIDALPGIKAERIIDAGANIGLASIFFSNLFPSAQIVAIEPQADNFNLLQKNLKPYEKVECIHAALWNKNEKINIKNPDSLAASYMVEADQFSSIEGITIPSLLERKGWDKVDILKMDIEGAEKEIFSAPADWLSKVRLLIIELHDNYNPGATKTFFKALEPYEYQAHFFDENIFIFFDQP
jgi:FkbM family methyltransferase